MNYAETLGVKAKAVESAIATAAPQVKNNALATIADALLSRQEEILAANAKDLEAAVQNHMTASLQDRLRLTPARSWYRLLSHILILPSANIVWEDKVCFIRVYLFHIWKKERLL